MKRISLLLFLGTFFITSSDALPKFATRQGAKCQSCHINPSGKGMRSAFGSTYGREELTMSTYKEETDFEDFTPMINDFLTIGMDYRTLYYSRESNSTSSFFQMQGDLYIDLRLNKKFRIYFDKGIYSGFEIFGLAKILPLDGYIKLGNFVPAYGLKMDDHNLIIRSGPFFPTNPAIASYPNGLGFGQGGEDTGIELGFAPGIFTVNVGLFNGRKGGLAGTAGTQNKTVVVRGDALIRSEMFNLNLGGSLYSLPNTFGSGKVQIVGGFGVLTLDHNLTIQGEYDIVTTFNATLNKEVSGNILYTELNYVILDGVDLKLGYEYYDPNIDVKDGTLTRYTVGAEFFPFAGVEVRPLYRINQEQPTELKNNELHIMFHFFL